MALLSWFRKDLKSIFRCFLSMFTLVLPAVVLGGDGLGQDLMPISSKNLNEETSLFTVAQPLLTVALNHLQPTKKNAYFLFDIRHVHNPHNLPITFTVHHRLPEKPLELLGSFSLYPASQPGRFIVATQGKMDQGGELLVQLDLPTLDSVQPSLVTRTSVRISMQPVRVVDGLVF